MIRVFIDEQELVMRSQPSVKMSYDSQAMKSIQGARTEKDVVIEVEADAENAAIFAGEGYLHLAQRFNASHHTGRIEHDGATIFTGDVIMLAVNKNAAVNAATMRFTLRFRCSGAEWAHNASSKMLAKSSVDLSTIMCITTMKNNWEDTTLPVQFFPVHRDSYREPNIITEVSVRRMRAIDDYHPFLRVKPLMESIFTTDGGCQIESKFMQTEQFENLYISGAYVGQESDVAKAAMNFCVKKLTDETTTTTSFGRVSISPGTSQSTIRRVIDIESLEEDENCFSYGDCFTQEGNMLTFTPLTSVDVGFEYRLVFKADYYIKSRTQIQTIDQYWLMNGGYITVEVANTVPDEREKNLMPNFTYMPIVFDHIEGRTYRLMGRMFGAEEYTIFGEWSDRTGYVKTPHFSYSDVVNQARVEYSEDGGTTYQELTDDWALYFGSDTERGQVIIDISVRTAPETLTPTSPKEFSMLILQGGVPNTEFTLMEGTTITPYFASYPGAGSVVHFEDIAQHSVWQSKFLESIQHLYNLRFYTDHAAKKVYIEPAEQIYDTLVKWDWSERVVQSMPVTFEDAAAESYRAYTFSYTDEDGFTKRTDAGNHYPYYLYPGAPEVEPEQEIAGAWSNTYGSWSTRVNSYAAKQSTKTAINPMYAPTQNTNTGLPIVGDRDDAEMINTLDFAPRVLQYTGEQVYDENEIVPHLAFHDKETGVSLCFEDRDGIRGLNRYYSDQIARSEWSQYVTLYIRLEAHEMADMLSPLEGRPSVLSTFLLKIEGEWAECRIEEIIESDLQAGVAKCKFLIVK